MGIGDSPQVLINGVPMKPEEMEADNFEESVVSQILRLTPALQKDVYHVSNHFNTTGSYRYFDIFSTSDHDILDSVIFCMDLQICEFLLIQPP